MTDHVVAIDLGTSGVKVALVDLHGSVVRSETLLYPLLSPHEGWAEADPRRWLSAVHTGLDRMAGRRGEKIIGVGIDGQMHGLVLGAGRDTVRAPILWPDARALDQLPKWRALPEGMRAPLANPLAPGMFGPMLGWLAEHEPEVLGRAEYACSPKDWIRCRLTGGEPVTEASDASATLAWDIPGHRWHTELLEHLSIPTGLLLRVTQPTDKAFLQEGGVLAGGLPVAVGSADTAAALLATQLQDEEVLVNLGTGIQVCMGGATPTATMTPTCHTYADAAGGWYSMVAPLNGGLALTRVAELLQADWPEIYNSLDAPVNAASRLSFSPWFAPDRLPRLRRGDAAGWQGLGLRSSRNDMLRAALESIAFQISQAILALPSAPTSIRFSGGGTRDVRMRQLICDTVGLPGRRSSVADATVQGAANLAFKATGLSPAWPVPREAELMAPRQDSTLVERCEEFRQRASAQQLDW